MTRILADGGTTAFIVIGIIVFAVARCFAWKGFRAYQKGAKEKEDQEKELRERRLKQIRDQDSEKDKEKKGDDAEHR